MVDTAPIVETHGGVKVVREDLRRFGDANGTKARALYAIASDAKLGVVTAGGRSSTQSLMMGCVARHLNLPFAYHCPAGDSTPILEFLESIGTRIERHRPGYGGVVSARGREDAAATGFTFIPTGVEGPRMIAVVSAAAAQVDFTGVSRLVVPVGSGMTLCGILRHVATLRNRPDVVGVSVGASPKRRLKLYAPANWQSFVEIVSPEISFKKSGPDDFHGVPVDPHYSGKCVSFLQSGDMFWNSGARQCVHAFTCTQPKT